MSRHWFNGNHSALRYQAANMCSIDDRIKSAAELSVDEIEASIPIDLLSELKEVSKALSVPWIGLLMGTVTTVQYAMGFSSVKLFNSDWVEPTILWILQHMPSGTRKSNISKFVDELSDAIEMDPDTKEIHKQFKVCETTFEKLGLMMKDNDGEIMWFSDEARHFFSQLGLYQKPGSIGNRDEAVLLSLYDGASWNHSTARGVQFSMPRTKLTLGGLSQTGHILKLFNQKDQMESGLIPRFVTIMLRPVQTSIREICCGKDKFYEKFVPILKKIRAFHEIPTTYNLLRTSPAFEIFAVYHEKTSAWIKKHQFKTAYQNAITMVSKSVGQIFRLSAILTGLMIFWDVNTVTTHEENSQFQCTPSVFSMFNSEGSNEEDEETDAASTSHDIPISLMAMECAIHLITYTVKQNLMIQGINFIKLNFDMNDVDSQIIDDVMEMTADGNDTSLLPGASSDTQNSITSMISPPSYVCNVMCFGGKILREWILTKYKKIGPKTTKNGILSIFQILESTGFGTRDVDGENSFTFHEDILDRLVVSEQLKDFMVEHLVSRVNFQAALRRTSAEKRKQSQKKMKTVSLEHNADKENKDINILKS